MDRKQWIEQVAEAFAANPEADKFHVCKDGQCFRTEHAARQHERMLGMGALGVELVTRESVERWKRGEPAVPKKKVTDETGAGEGEQGGEGSGTEAAASDQSAGADTGNDDDVERAKKALEEELEAKTQEKASAPKEPAAKKAAPKKAATKKTTKKK